MSSSFIYVSFWFAVVISLGACKYADERDAADVCITGTIITVSCPDRLVVQADDGAVGVHWTYEGTHYNNALILLTDMPTGATIGSTLFFTVDHSKGPKDCFVASPCPLNVSPYPEAPEFCVLKLSLTGCGK